MMTDEAASAIRTGPLQLPNDNLSFVVTRNIRNISSFGQTAQWLGRVHGKHEVVGLDPIRANFLYGIEKP